MAELTLLTKLIIFIFVGIFIYKTNILKSVFDFLNDKFEFLFGKLVKYKVIRKEYDFEHRQRLKIYERFKKNKGRDSEL